MTIKCTVLYIYTYNSKTQCRKIVATLSFNHNCQTFWSFRITIGMFLTGSHRTGPVIEVQILSNNTDRLEEPADGCRAGGVLGYTHTYTHTSHCLCAFKEYRIIRIDIQIITTIYQRAAKTHVSCLAELGYHRLRNDFPCGRLTFVGLWGY